MPKTCNAQSCTRSQWGGGYCSSHQYLRDDIASIKRERHQLKRSGKLKPHSQKYLERLPERVEESKKMWEWIKAEIWDKRPHYSEVSGQYLGEEFKTYMAEHLLEKSKYPHLSMEPDNILLVTLEEHAAKTAGHPLPLHQQAIERAKKQFLQ